MSTQKILDLRNLPDAERDARVNEAVAVHVAGYMKRNDWSGRLDKGDEQAVISPPFSTSADAVLPLLEKHARWECNYVGDATWKDRAYCCELNGRKEMAPTIPLAACLTLLRANGVEVLT